MFSNIVGRENNDAIVALQKRLDPEWSAAWNLRGAEKVDTPDGAKAIVVTWERTEAGSTLVRRIDSFSLAGEHQKAQVRIYQGDRLVGLEYPYYSSDQSTAYSDIPDDANLECTKRTRTSASTHADAGVVASSTVRELSDAAMAGDRAWIAAYQKAIEPSWSNEWQLVRSAITEEHGNRCVIAISWARTEAHDRLVQRVDSFSIDGQRDVAEERVYEKAELLSVGRVYFASDGSTRYKDIRYRAEPEYFELESYPRKGRAVYRSLHPFYIDDSDRTTIRLGRVPSDAKLVSGPRDPLVDRARLSH